MEKIKSKDGTPIAYQRSGAGTPLVLVHGADSDHTRWAPVLPALEKHFCVYAVDRRGRGESGDADIYRIEREFEDVAAVVDSIGEPVHLLGHSYGGICSLEAALLTRNIRRLILYEPPIPVEGVPIYPEGFIERLQQLLDSGDREGTMTTFLREIVGVPPEEIAALRSSPAFSARVAAAHTLPRELRAHDRYRFVAERFANVRIPVLLLLGEKSPRFFKVGLDAVHAALPTSRMVVMPGQQHGAVDTAPDLFVRETLEFLRDRG